MTRLMLSDPMIVAVRILACELAEIAQEHKGRLEVVMMRLDLVAVFRLRRVQLAVSHQNAEPPDLSES